MSRRAVLWLVVGLGLLAAAVATSALVTWRMCQPETLPPVSVRAAPSTRTERPVASPIPWQTARACPVSALAFVAVRDPATLAGRLSASGEGRSVLAQAAWLKAISEQRLGTPLVPASFLERLASARCVEAALVLTDVDTPPLSRPVPHLLLLMNGDEALLSKTALDLFAGLKASEPDLQERELLFEKQVPMHLLGDGEVSLGWAVRDGILIMASHEIGLRQALQAVSGQAPALQSSGPFRALSEALGPDVLAYLKTSPLWERLESSRRKPFLQALGTEAMAAGMDASGKESFLAASRIPVPLPLLAGALLEALDLKTQGSQGNGGGGALASLGEALPAQNASATGLLRWDVSDPVRIPLFLATLQDAP